MKNKKMRAFVKRQRKLLGIRQAELSKLTGIHRTRLSAFENNRVNLNLGELEKVMDAFAAQVHQRSEAGTLPWPKIESAAAGEHGTMTKKMRRWYGITQQELAAGTGLEQDLISLYENGYSRLDAEDRSRIDAFLEKCIGRRRAEIEKTGKVSLAELMGARPKREAKLPAEAEKKEPILHGFDDPQHASDMTREILRESGKLLAENKALSEVNAELERALALREKIANLTDELIEAFKGRLAELEAEEQVTKGQVGALREWLDSELLAAVANEDAEKKRESAHRLATTASEKE